MSWQVRFVDLDTTIPFGCTVAVKSYSVNDRGGCESAELAVTGQPAALAALLPWLGQRLRIANPVGRTVWFGIVSELQIGFGGFAIGASLTEMANRVAITYAELDATGAATQTTTAWLDNADSQAQFGVKELLYSAGDASSEQATAKRAELLANLAWPLGIATVTPAVGATVRCIGLAQTLGWKYYTNLNGRISNPDADGGSIAVGWQLTSAEIGFKQAEGIFSFGDNLGGPEVGDIIVVSGSASNNGTRSVTGKTTDNETYAAATISFDPSDDILDGANGLAALSANAFAKITGSASNSGVHWIKSKVTDGHLTIDTSLSRALVSAAAGPTVTLVQDGKLSVGETLVNEGVGATVTLTLVGYVIAQSFVPSINMTTGKIGVRVGKVGGPTDSFAVRVCSDSGGWPGTVLGSATILGSALGDAADIWLTLPGLALTASTTYWLKFERTGSVDAANYYTLGLSETAYGTTRAWNGSTWGIFVQNGIAKSVTFRLWDTEDTSASAARIVSQCGQAFVTSLSMAATGVTRCQYNDNGATALQELTKLLDLGAAAGARLVAAVDEMGVLTVTTEPTMNAPADSVLHQDGYMYDASGSLWDIGRLPVAEWVNLGGMPEDINSAWRISPIFVQKASFDVSRRRLSLTPRNARQLLQLFQNG